MHAQGSAFLLFLILLLVNVNHHGCTRLSSGCGPADLKALAIVRGPNMECLALASLVGLGFIPSLVFVHIRWIRELSKRFSLLP